MRSVVLYAGLVILFVSTSETSSSPLPGPPVFYKVRTFPSLCYLPPDSGACDNGVDTDLKRTKSQVRYYYDTATEECYPFSFMQPHCSKNANNFASLEKCRSYCNNTS